MKNYMDSDYAINKFSPNIVYRFSDEIHEITLEQYLKSNPNKTEEDFIELKAISDEDYRKGKLSIHSLEEGAAIGVASFEDKLILDEDKKKALKAAYELLEKGGLTEIQKRRFIQHYFIGVSMREIARLENVYHTSVMRSLEYARGKLKNIFKKF